MNLGRPDRTKSPAMVGLPALSAVQNRRREGAAKGDNPSNFQIRLTANSFVQLPVTGFHLWTLLLDLQTIMNWAI